MNRDEQADFDRALRQHPNILIYLDGQHVKMATSKLTPGQVVQVLQTALATVQVGIMESAIESPIATPNPIDVATYSKAREN